MMGATPAPYGLCVYCGRFSWRSHNGEPAHECCVLSQGLPQHEQCPCLNGAPTLNLDEQEPMI